MSCKTLEDKEVLEVQISSEQYNSILDFQQKILFMIASRENYKAILEALCKQAEQLLPNSVASVMLLDERTGLMSILAAPTVPEEGHLALQNLKPGKHGGSCGNAVFHNEAQFVANTFTDDRWKDLQKLAIDFHLCSCWSMPIHNEKKQPIGTFALSSFEHRSPALFHKKLLETASSIVSIVLKNKDDEEKITLFSNAMQNASDGMIVTNKENKIIDVNQSFLKNYGYKKENVLGKNPKIFSSDKNSDLVYKNMWKSIKKHSRWSGEIINKDANGNEITQWVSISSLKDENNYLAIFTDLTELITIQTELKKLSLAVEESLSAIIMTDVDGNIEYANKSFFKIFNKYNSIEDLQNNNIKFSDNFEQINHPNYIQGELINDMNWIDYLKNHHEQVFNVAIKKENKLLHFIIKVAQTATEDDAFIVIELNDITKDIEARESLKENEKIMYEQSKMASMGEMIGNIAHQWRQPLSVISTGATGLQVQKEYGILSDKIFQETCEMINLNAQYLSKTIDDFRNFIKGERVKRKFILEETIKSLLELVDSSIKNHEISIVLDLHKDVSLEGYENELVQCFINIFNNAKDVLDEIKGDKYLFITTKEENGEIKIIFKDNAGGIPLDILPKIFEPYFTTKHQKQGTGLGLSMVYSLIVEGMGGHIIAENETFFHNEQEYTGAQFIITL